MFPDHNPDDSDDPEDQAPCARCVARQLQDWIDEAMRAAVVPEDWWFPVVELTATAHTLHILIGGITVWDSDEDDPEDLTFAYCQQAYRTAVLPLAHVASYGLKPKAP